MAVFRPVWVYPDGYVELTTNNQGRATQARVHVPPAMVGRVTITDATNTRSWSNDFPAGDTIIPFQPAEPLDNGMTVGMEVFTP